MTTLTPISNAYASVASTSAKRPTASDGATPASQRITASDPNAFLKELATKYDLTDIKGKDDFDNLCRDLVESGTVSLQDSGFLMVLGLQYHQPLGYPQGDPNAHCNLLQNAKDNLEFYKGYDRNNVPPLERLISTFESLGRLRDGQPATHWVA